MEFESILIQIIHKIVPIIPVVLVDRIDGAREEDGMISACFRSSCPAKLSTAQSWVSILLAVYGATLLVGSRTL